MLCFLNASGVVVMSAALAADQCLSLSSSLRGGAKAGHDLWPRSSHLEQLSQDFRRAYVSHGIRLIHQVHQQASSCALLVWIVWPVLMQPRSMGNIYQFIACPCMRHIE